jgi:hypothetical protein
VLPAVFTALSLLDASFSISLIEILGLIGETCASCMAARTRGGLSGAWWTVWAKVPSQPCIAIRRTADCAYLGKRQFGLYRCGDRWGIRWYCGCMVCCALCTPLYSKPLKQNWASSVSMQTVVRISIAVFGRNTVFSVEMLCTRKKIVTLEHCALVCLHRREEPVINCKTASVWRVRRKCSRDIHFPSASPDVGHNNVGRLSATCAALAKQVNP